MKSRCIFADSGRPASQLYDCRNDNGIVGNDNSQAVWHIEFLSTTILALGQAVVPAESETCVYPPVYTIHMFMATARRSRVAWGRSAFTTSALSYSQATVGVRRRLTLFLLPRSAYRTALSSTQAAVHCLERGTRLEASILAIRSQLVVWYEYFSNGRDRCFSLAQVSAVLFFSL